MLRFDAEGLQAFASCVGLPRLPLVRLKIIAPDDAIREKRILHTFDSQFQIHEERYKE
jgi:hypothetical protein